jgi:chromosome partitioning protein
MPKTIAFTNIKGGAGKTTLSITLAVCLHRSSKRVLIVDTDPEETSLVWASKAGEAGYEGPPVIRMDGRNLRRDLARVSAGFDWVIIDTPGNNGPAARAAMLVADLILIPVAPGGPDWWMLEKTLAVLEDARQVRPDVKALIVLNRTDGTVIARNAAEALHKGEVPVLDASLARRVAIGEAIMTGQGVTEYAPDSEAAREAQKFSKAVVRAARES